MIGTTLNLQAESLIGMFIVTDSEENSRKVYNMILDKANKEIYPKITGYIEKQQILKQVHDCKTIKELEELKLRGLYPEMFEDIMTLVNDEESLTEDSERIFMASQLVDFFIIGVQQWVAGVAEQRARVISQGQKPKKRIIDPNAIMKNNGFPGKGGLIIT